MSIHSVRYHGCNIPCGSEDPCMIKRNIDDCVMLVISRVGNQLSVFISS